MNAAPPARRIRSSPLDPVRRLQASDRGFTLLEVVIATTIIGIIFSFVFGTFFSALRNKEYVESRDEIYHSARTILHRMSVELNSAYLPSPPKMRAIPATPARPIAAPVSNQGIFFGEDFREYDRDLDHLVFFNLGHFLFYPLNPESEETRLESENLETEYYGRVDYEKDITYLIRRENLLFHWPSPSEEGASYAMHDNLQMMNFRFYHQEKGIGNWYDEWDSSDSARTPAGLPFAVEVRIILLDNEERAIPFSTLVDIPRAWGDQ